MKIHTTISTDTLIHGVVTANIGGGASGGLNRYYHPWPRANPSGDGGTAGIKQI